MRKDCTVGKLSERNEADDEEVICRRNWSCMNGVRVAQPQSELGVQSRSQKWVVPLHMACMTPASIAYIATQVCASLHGI